MSGRWPPLAERFAAKWLGEPNSGCWLWVGGMSGNGYGLLWTGNRIEPAHRVAYELYRGPVPTGMLVCHKCDTPSCVNPDHLFVGSNDDNMADKVAKGRQARFLGEANGRAKLTYDQALAIRADARKSSAIMAEYGVGYSTICRIRLNQIWTAPSNGKLP